MRGLQMIGRRCTISAAALGGNRAVHGIIGAQTNDAIMVRLDNGETVWARMDQVTFEPEAGLAFEDMNEPEEPEHADH